MPIQLRKPARSESRGASLPLYIGFGAAVVFFILSGYNAFRNVQSLRQGAIQVERAYTVMDSLDNILSLVKDAETGQRGFLITGDESYLQPYHAVRTRISAELSRMREFAMNSAVHKEYLPLVEAQVASKLAELEETIALRRESGFEAARAVVVTDRGKQTMDGLRDNLSSMAREEARVRDLRIADMETAHRVALGSGIVTACLGIALSAAVMALIRRAQSLRRRQEWSQTGRLELASNMSGEKGLKDLSESILAFLTHYLDAHAGVVFAERRGRFERMALVGAPAESAIPEHFSSGEGLLGQAVVDKTLRSIADVPEGYLMVGSGLGQGIPRHLIIVPALADESANAVIELGFLNPPGKQKQDFLIQISELVGVAVKSALYRENLQELLEETQQQSEELMAQSEELIAQSEELRVSNEELEEQGRVLQQSQARLELQQVEMEQTNTQLSEQARMLGDQKEQLLIGKEALETQARAVEQASRYKSDFLANMSHELRTPLNSSLILAKLLGENKSGNLLPEQVKYAKTIESAGNDLLLLINDVLDLSKIEAGHMEIHTETVPLARLLSSLRDTFEPVAGQKSIALKISAGAEVAANLETDPQRLEQVLKNLLSNALKFTEKGSVELHVTVADADRVSFAVKDTGIGITAEQQQLIFDPFSQADGTTARKYGGTGLGLSISNNLVRLLGGEIRLTSQPGAGSTFTVLIPRTYSGASSVQLPLPAAIKEFTLEEELQPSEARLMGLIPDDRATLAGDRRVILAVEDDEPFARIIYELTHELNFQCLIATSAEEALELARQFVPSAIVLDVGLPDNSGLLVLDRLKSDPRTRHIPVHVVSASDHSKTALSLGAVGYLLKPVNRDQLAETFRDLESRFTRKMRRVIVVEDDAVQMEALQHLLGSRDVETVGASTAAECLEKLQGETFDCMVLDLSLPDASGFTLLETLSAGSRYTLPPVIVYTGRDLKHDEEQLLRRYSNSIIIKGAKSPERLLDEVTLFLHQVVSELPPEKQKMLEKGNNRDAALEGRCILVAEDDVRNIFALTSVLEGRGIKLKIARNGREAITALEAASVSPNEKIELILMDVMMPEMDGLSAMREIRKRHDWAKIPIIALTAKAMKNDQEQCLAAGANDYLSKPLDVEKLLSLIRVWMPR